MSNTAGDPPYHYQSACDVYYCPSCNAWHNQPCNKYWNSGVAVSYTVNRDDEIVELLKQILKKLEEIRMEIP